MFSFRRPSVNAIGRFLAEQARLDFTYSAVGATERTPPTGYVVDHTRIKLGEGEQVYEAAKQAMRRWVHFRLGWVESLPSVIPIQTGQVVGVIARTFGVWCLNACKIVSVLDVAGSPGRFGFIYGTLPGHVESGEERFQLEWDHDTDGVWYDILAFSRPHHLLTRLGYPLVRIAQKRFARDSAMCMFRAVSPDEPMPEIHQIAMTS
ncbi:MAG: DUF1990 domain-containing protein [Fuerstia sp.]|nr:DUF1990 domain-containing protein [Fuerstiella sp.]